MNMNSAHFLQLFEMPMNSMTFHGNWNKDDDMRPDDDEFGGKLDGTDYGQYDKKSVRELPKNVEKFRKYFASCPYNFDFVMIREQPQGDDPYADDDYVEYGAIEQGSEAEKRFASYVDPQPDAITVILTNNQADDLVSIDKTGNFAHRLGHAFFARKGNQVMRPYRQQLEETLSQMLDHLVNYWQLDDNLSRTITTPARSAPGEASQYRWMYPGADEALVVSEMLTQIANGPKGLNACKAGRLTRPLEFLHEALANFFRYGEVNFNAGPLKPIRTKFFEDKEEEERLKWECMRYPPHPDDPDEYDYDAEPEFDEEEWMYMTSARVIDEMDEGEMDGWARTFSIYIEQMLDAAVGHTFIM